MDVAVLHKSGVFYYSTVYAKQATQSRKQIGDLNPPEPVEASSASLSFKTDIDITKALVSRRPRALCIRESVVDLHIDPRREAPQHAQSTMCYQSNSKKEIQ